MKWIPKNFDDFWWPNTLSPELQGLKFKDFQEVHEHWISIPWEAHEMTLTCMRVMIIIEAAFIKLVISHWFVLQLITMGEQLINNFSCIQDWLHAEICTSAMRRGAPLSCHVCTEGNKLSATGKASSFFFFFAFLSSSNIGKLEKTECKGHSSTDIKSQKENLHSAFAKLRKDALW